MVAHGRRGDNVTSSWRSSQAHRLIAQAEPCRCAPGSAAVDKGSRVRMIITRKLKLAVAGCCIAALAGCQTSSPPPPMVVPAAFTALGTSAPYLLGDVIGGYKARAAKMRAAKIRPLTAAAVGPYMADLDAEFVNKISPGDIVVAGGNFGCGSSREVAPLSIKASGIAAVVAPSFARIFYRNAVNIGLPVLVCEEVVLSSADGQDLEIDLATGVIHNITTGQKFQAEPLNPFVARIVAAGGIIEYIRQEGALR